MSDELEQLSVETLDEEVVAATHGVELDRTSLLARHHSIEDDASQRRRAMFDEVDSTDIISAQVMAGSRGLALCCVITISLCMSACSFLMLYQFDVEESSRHSGSDTIEPESLAEESLVDEAESLNSFCDVAQPSDLPLGQRMLEFQIHVIQNLVHASLVGSAAMVAAVRGDALWMYYVRNVAFFFIPIGFVYFFLDLRSVWIGESAVVDHKVRLSLSFLSGLAATIAFAVYTPTFLRIRQMICEWSNAGFKIDPVLRYPRHVAENVVEAHLSTIIYMTATIAQLLAWLYYVTTILQWFAKQSSCAMGDSTATANTHSTLEDLRAFELAYSSGAHQALLIALFFLAATYPRDFASVGGALLTSSWRFIVAMGSLIHLLTENKAVPLLSWVNTSVEVVLMIPILVASALLVYRIMRNQQMQNSGSFDAAHKDNSNTSSCSLRYRCASLSQIARSTQFSLEQRRGAQLILNGTRLLLLEMTAECIIMLQPHRIGTDMSHEIYKWGMHICVMYIFCSVMCVETPFIYHKARKLLLAACPSGSLVAMWQLSTLLRRTVNLSVDTFAQLVACLLFIRTLSGLTQMVGLFQLTTLEPLRPKAAAMNLNDKPQVSNLISYRLAQLRAALYGIYFSIMISYIFAFSVLGNCHPPMISGSISGDVCAVNPSTTLSLAQNWPGLGLVFHYGMIIVIFASNGSQLSTPSYKPSLSIASLFSIHAFALIGAHLLWDAVQSDMWSIVPISQADIARRFLAFLWMAVSLLLWFCCERVVQARVESL